MPLDFTAEVIRDAVSGFNAVFSFYSFCKMCVEWLLIPSISCNYSYHVLVACFLQVVPIMYVFL